MRNSQNFPAFGAIQRVYASLTFGLLIALLPLTGRAAGVTTNFLAKGTRFATPFYVHDSGNPGPTVMIVGGMHGNEPAGAEAAEVIRNGTFLCGKVVIIPRANALALTAGKRQIPGLETNLSNLNRNFPRVGQNEPPRGDLAEAIWSVATQYKPDWLIDLHEGYDFSQINSNSVGSSIIVSKQKAAVESAEVMLSAVNATITDGLPKFVRRGPPINGSLAAAAAAHLQIPAMIVETTSSSQSLAKRSEQHQIMVHALFEHIGMSKESVREQTERRFATGFGGTLIEPISRLETGAPPEARAEIQNSRLATDKTRIGIFQGAGSGGSGVTNVFNLLEPRADVRVQLVTAGEIREGALKNFDVIVFTGGSGSKQAETLGEEARKEVRQFVESGGRYMGICAGSYLATSGYPWSLRIINAKTVSPKWYRGKTASVDMELSGKGAEVYGKFGNTNLQTSVRYHNGPIVKPAELFDLPPYEPLAWFRSEVVTNDVPVGIMVNSPAIISSHFGKGRVLCISPHPEATQGLEYLISKSVDWLIGKDQGSHADKKPPGKEGA